MDYKYQGYMGKDTDLLKSLSRASSTFAKFQEEEEERLEEERLLAQSQEAAKATEEADKPWYEQVGKFLGEAGANVGNFVKDAAVDVYKTGESAIAGTGNVLQGQNSARNVEAVTEERNEATSEWNKYLETLKEEDFDKPEVKAKLQEFQEKVEGIKVSDEDQRQLDEAQDVDAQKVAADTAETYLNIATLGTGAGVKALAKGGIKELTKQGAGKVTKDIVRGAGEGAVLSGAAGLTDAISEDMDAEDAVANVAQSAGFGALLGGASAGVGSVGAVRGNNKAVVAQDAAKATEDAARLAEEAALKVDEEEAAALLARPFKDAPEDDIRTQINEFIEGGGRTDNVQADYARLQTLKDELSTRERESYFADGGLTKAEAKKALEDFDAGNMPESVYKPAEPVSAAVEVMARDDMPVELKAAAEEVVQDRKVVEDQLFNLMSPQTKDAEITRLDEGYNAALQELQKRYSTLEQPRKGADSQVDQTSNGQRMSGDYKSDIRFSVAKDKLDEQYKNDVAELDLLEAQDMEEVAKFQGILETLDRRDAQISNDANRLMGSAPDSFRDIDAAEMNAQRKMLEDRVSQAERFDDGKGIVLEAATSPDPVKSIENNPDGTASVRADIAETTTHLEAFKNAGSVRQSALGILSPSKNFEAFGLRELHDAIVVGDAKLQLANKADFEKLKPIAQAIKGNKDLQRQIVDYLEGGRQTLSATDTATADAIRTLLDEKKAWLKENGFATLDDYFPHMFDVKSAEAKRIFNAKTTGEIKFGNIKQRISESDDYSRDIIDVLSAYTQGINKKIHLEPTLKPLDDLKVMDKVTDMEADWINKYIAQLKGTGPRSGIEKGFNSVVDGFLGKVNSGAVGGNHYRSVLGGQRMISAVATMGLNPGTAIRNLTQVVNTVAGIGPKWSTVGMVHGARALRAGKDSPEFKEMTEAGVFSGGVSKNYNADLDEFSTKITGLRGKSNAVANKMMLMVSSTDAVMRGQAYWGAKAQALSKGMDEDAAKAFAREKVIDTQFITSKVDMPTGLNGPGMRSLTQLATFSAKQAEFMASLGVNLVKGKDGTYSMGRGEQALNLLGAAAAAGTATAVLEPLIGFNSEEFIPFYPQIAPFIPGADKEVSDALYRSPLVTLLAGDGKSKMGLVEAIQSGDPGGFLKDQWSAIVPAGTQIKKSIEGFTTTESGISKNDKGNIRYLQDMDVDSQIKATLFGQYATEAGKNWIEQGFPTLSEKQTSEVEAQPTREAQEQYATFYVATKKATGRQDAYDAVKDAAASGDRNKAARLAQEYNDKVNTALGSYWAEHDELPKELREELTSRVYINVNKIKTKKEE